MDPLARKLAWLMGLRVVIVTALLGSTIAVNVFGSGTYTAFDPTQVFLYGTIIATYVLTIVYALLLRLWRNTWVQSYVQIVGDVLICAALVYITGGHDSIFLFVYSLTIINASILLDRSGALFAAASSWTSFGFLVAAQANGWIPLVPGQLGPDPPFKMRDVVFSLCMSFAGFHLVALLSGHLATQLRTAAQALAQERRALEAMKALHASIVTTLNDALVVVDRAGRITFTNRALEDLLDVTSAHVLGRPLSAVIPMAGEALGAEPVRHHELALTRADGATVHLRLSASPHVDQNGRRDGSVVLIHDMTHLRAMEAAVKTSERLAAIGEVAAGLAHEIRNPLASLSGSIELLRSRAEAAHDDNGRRLMDIVLRETDRLNHLITDFLGFARPSQPHTESVEVDRLVEDTLAVFCNDVALGANHEVVTELRCNGTCARVDLGQIKQVLWNLLVNAHQAMPDGGVITISSYAEPDNRGRAGVVVEVVDQGPGVAPADRSRIFDPFYTTKSTGTGLGLATVHRIVDAHGGTVEVDSSRSGGAIFRIRLPAG